MNKKRIPILIPVLIIAIILIYTWSDFLFNDSIATMPHYAGLVFF
jgi:hypothetical protein